MLLARRKGQDKAASAFGVDGLASQTSRHLPHVFHPGGEQPEIGTAEAQRVAEALTFADRDIGIHLARGAQGAESDRIGKDSDQKRAARARGGGDRG